jgi:hypothetical protein
MKKDDTSKPDDILQEHGSPLRSMMAESGMISYHPLRSLEEAQSYDDGVVVLQGDDGGQLYVVCPARLVSCSSETLRQLLLDLDARIWKDASMARVFYERKPVGGGIAGGMGGGRVIEGVWVQSELRGMGLEPGIASVLRGERDRIGTPVAEQP